MPITFVAIGTGDHHNLTYGAHAAITAADRVYVMAGPKSWMLTFLAELVGTTKLRSYMPASVAWGEWHTDPILTQIADEIAADDRAGLHVTLITAGDVSIYPNVAPIVPLLRERSLTWDVAPGVSFLNAIAGETGEPLIWEGENLFILGSGQIDDLEKALNLADVAVIYHPSGVNGLDQYVRTAPLASAHTIMVGVTGRDGSITDLRADITAKPGGLVLVRKPRANKKAIPYHLGPTAWDSRGRMIATAYPDTILIAEDGRPASLRRRHCFEHQPQDIRGLFVDSRDAIIISLKGFTKPPFGRTYLSCDGGASFSVALPLCCWGFDETPDGDLFGGVYHERGEPDLRCAVMWSGDGGATWSDVALPEWPSHGHVHHLAVDPGSGWLYAALGDVPKCRGIWRSRVIRPRIMRAAAVGESRIEISLLPGIGPGSRLVVPGHAREVVTVAAVAQEGTLLLTEPLAVSIESGTRLYLLDWVRVCHRPEDPLQFTGLAFHGNHIYLADDNGGARNPTRVAVWRFRDDDSEAHLPEAVLTPPPGSGWGVFFIETDCTGQLWAGIRPVGGQGQVWRSGNGTDWALAAIADQEDLPLWRGTHTFRDSSLGQTGDGRNLSPPGGGIVTTLLNRPLILR